MSRRKKRSGPAANRAARKSGSLAPHSGSKSTPAVGWTVVNEYRYAWLADEALRTGQPVVDDELAAVPDVALAEGFANGLPVPPTITLQRADGRSVAFYRRPPGTGPLRGEV